MFMHIHLHQHTGAGACTHKETRDSRAQKYVYVHG